MKIIRKWLIGSDRNISGRNIIWNMLGSTVYAFATLFLTAVTGHLAGEAAGGRFSFAFSVGQLLLSISYFGVRPYHQTDVSGKYSFQDYLHVRIVTCLLTVAGGMVYIAVSGFTPGKAAVVFLLVLFKLADGFADVYEVEFQRRNRLYLAGKSNFFRTLLSMGVYVAVLAATRNLVLACGAAVAAAAAGVILFDISIEGFLPYIGRTELGRDMSIVRECVLICIASFMESYILNASKYAIEAGMGDKAVYSYTAIFQPTMVINLVAGYIIRPFLTGMVIKWERRRRRAFAAEVGKILAVIAVLSVLALVLGYYLGPPVLGLICGTDVTPYRDALLVVIGGGSLYAGVTLLYYVLMIFRKQRFLFAIYGAVFLVSWFLTPLVVARMGIMGGAVAYFIMMALMFVLFAGYAGVCFLTWKKG